jgi:uncharacterized phage infection (PIP) family protein YhgE
MLRSLVLIVLAISAWLPLTAVDLVEVHLRSGQVMKGELVSQDADKVVVKSNSTGKSGKTMSITMTYRRDDIADLVELGDPEDTYRTRNAAATTAADHAKLAAWCTDMGMGARALEQAERAVDLDPSQEACAKLALDAGWVRSDGKWVKEADLLAAEGKVRYQGKIMTIAEADELKAAAKKQNALADAQKEAEEKAGAVAYYDRLAAELKKRSPVLASELAKAKADVATAEAAAPKLIAAKTAADTAQANLDQARSSPPAGTSNPNNSLNNNTNYLTPYTQAVNAAQVNLTNAKKAEAAAENDLPTLRGKVSTLENEKKILERKLAELSAKRDAALKAQDQAKSDATKAADDAAKPDAPAPAAAAAAAPPAAAAPAAPPAPKP